MNPWSLKIKIKKHVENQEFPELEIWLISRICLESKVRESVQNPIQTIDPFRVLHLCQIRNLFI